MLAHVAGMPVGGGSGGSGELPPGRKRQFKGGKTPKCGDCKHCNNPKYKQACITNRERLSQGLEPEFKTEEARRNYEGSKKAKVESE